MKYYVISDPHGFYTETVAALKSAGYFDDPSEHRLVVVGDLLDRGGEANKMVEFMMDQDRLGLLIYVIGNHEDLLVDALQTLARGDVFRVASPTTHHYHNGTWDTILQLAEMEESYAISAPRELVRKVLDHDFYRHLLYRAVDYFETPNYVFTHGYIPCLTEGFRPVISAEYDPHWRDATPQGWRTARWYNGMEMSYLHGVRIPDKTVVCGHWHASYGHAIIEGRCNEFGEGADFSPFFGDGIIAIDACTKVSGKVNCLVLED
jgi:serine/threonine protein phosphatase 1